MQTFDEPASHDAWEWRAVEGLAWDLKYGVCSLRRSRRFAVAAVVILALGIGGNVAVFSVVKAVVLDALGYRDPGRLVSVRETKPTFADVPRFAGGAPARAATFETWQRQCRLAESMAAYEPTQADLAGSEGTDRIAVARVSVGLFDLLGVGALIGRPLAAGDDQPGRDNVVVISHRLWQQRLHGRPDVVGMSLLLDGRAFVVTGVMPAEFQFPPDDVQEVRRTRAELWKPLVFTANDRGGNYNFSVVARLRRGVSLERMQAGMEAITAASRRADPKACEKVGVAVAWLHEDAVAGLRHGMLILFGATALLLLVVCANLANLLLSRAAGRRREIAVRMALGASRLRIVRQVLTEAVLLALVGGAAGLLLSAWMIRPLIALAPDIPRLDRVTLDLGVVVFAVGASLLTGLLFGLLAAFELSRANPGEAVKTGSLADSSRRGARTRSALMVTELAISVVLVAGAMLLLRSFVRVLDIDKGFSADEVLTLRLSPPRYRYKLPQFNVFYQELERRIAALAGVGAVGLANSLPLTVDVFNVRGTLAEFQAPPPADGPEPRAEWRTVTRNYFKTLGIGLRSGRGFLDSDTSASPAVAIINATMARQFWPGADPLGKRFRESSGGPWIEVIGVATDVRQQGGLEVEPGPQVYVPAAQGFLGYATLIVRTEKSARDVAATLGRVIREVGPGVAVDDVQTMAEVVDRALARRRFQALLVMLFAGLALLVASVGVYGVVSYSAAQRRTEIGVRMALGATRRDVSRLILTQALRFLVPGIGLGLLAAVLLTRVLRSSLYAVSPGDPGSLLCACALPALSALVAVYLPARHTTRMDPAIALRCE